MSVVGPKGDSFCGAVLRHKEGELFIVSNEPLSIVAPLVNRGGSRLLAGVALWLYGYPRSSVSDTYRSERGCSSKLMALLLALQTMTNACRNLMNWSRELIGLPFECFVNRRQAGHVVKPNATLVFA